MQQKLHRIDWTELDWPEAARLQGRAAGQGLACARNSAVPAEGLRSEVTSRSSRAPSNSSVSESSRSSARHTARRCRRTASRCGRRSSHCTPAAPPPCHRQQHVTSDRRISGPAPAEPQPLKCQQVPLLRKLSVVRQLQMPACDARMTRSTLGAIVGRGEWLRCGGAFRGETAFRGGAGRCGCSFAGGGDSGGRLRVAGNARAVCSAPTKADATNILLACAQTEMRSIVRLSGDFSSSSAPPRGSRLDSDCDVWGACVST